MDDEAAWALVQALERLIKIQHAVLIMQMVATRQSREEEDWSGAVAEAMRLAQVLTGETV
jgi:hypothetical protein